MSEEVFEAAKIRLAEVPPTACAACYGQYPLRRHVDFGAAYDGPMLPPDQEVVGGKAVSIDDLVICDECLAAGARLVGLVDPGQIKVANEQLTARLEETTERLAGALAYAKRMEQTLATREELAAQLRPPAPKPRKPRGAGK